MAGYSLNVWQYIKLVIDPDPFCTSCQISSINEKSWSQNPLKPKAPFKWVYGYYSSNITKKFDK